MATSGVGATGSTNYTDPTSGKNPMDSMDMSQFIKLLVAELQNQDPTQPMSNSELLQQVSQMRAIASNDKLSSTLDNVSLGQSLATAGSMIYRTITGLDDNGDQVEGQVTSVSVDDGVTKLHVGDKTVSLKNVATLE